MYLTTSAVDGIQNHTETVDLFYCDPPYNTGRDFYNFDDRFKSSQDYRELFVKPIVQAMKSKLSKQGVVVFHVEPRISHHIRIILDDVFGENRFVNEICWLSGGNHHSKYKLQRSHDSLIVYSHSSSYTFNPEYKPYSDSIKYKEDDHGKYTTSALKNSQPDVIPRPNLRYDWNGNHEQWYCSKERMLELHNQNRLVYNNKGIPRIKKYLNELKGVPIKDVWDDISQIQGKEKLPYATQKPVRLLKRIVSMFSNPNDLVCDPTAGSGTTGRACQELNRRYILFDTNPTAKELFYANTC